MQAKDKKKFSDVCPAETEADSELQPIVEGS